MKSQRGGGVWNLVVRIRSPCDGEYAKVRCLRPSRMEGGVTKRISSASAWLFLPAHPPRAVLVLIFLRTPHYHEPQAFHRCLCLRLCSLSCVSACCQVRSLLRRLAPLSPARATDNTFPRTGKRQKLKRPRSH